MRAAFDGQIRRKAEPDEPGAVVEADDGVLRWVAPGNADLLHHLVAADRRTRLTPLSPRRRRTSLPAARRSSGSTTTTTSPPTCRSGCVAAGFEPDDDELMLVAETAAIDSRVVLPDGVRLVPVIDEAGLAAMMAVHDLAFADHPSPELGDRLRAS